MNKYIQCILFASVFMLPSAGAVFADDKTVEDQISFQVKAGEDVDNDRMTAILSVSAEDKRPSAVADMMNKTMAWALAQAKGFKKVKASSGRYQTHAVYDKNRISRWRGSQQLQLESDNFEQLTTLVGELQTKLQVQSMQFSVSPELRQKLEDGLIEKALENYQARAQTIQKALSADGYDLVNLSINTGSAGRVMHRRVEVAMMSSHAAAPAVESGTSRLTVNISATIQLKQN